MSYGLLNIAGTPSIQAVHQAMGAEALCDRVEGRTFDRFSLQETAFIAARDTVYLATVSQTGWPYVQHRGGLLDFLKVLDETTVAFTDYRGNRPYISVENLAADNRAALITMDYPDHLRLKIYAHVMAVPLEADSDLTTRAIGQTSRAKREHILKIRLVAFDGNCPQHITPRFTGAEQGGAMQRLRNRLTQVEAENAQPRAAARRPRAGARVRRLRSPRGSADAF